MYTLPYELWDVETGNSLGAYADEATALAEIRAGVRHDGAEAWASVGLLRRGDGTHETTVIAEGEALIARAHAARDSGDIGRLAATATATLAKAN